MPVVGHVVEAVAVKGHAAVGMACRGVVGIERIVGAYPVVLASVAENEFGRGGTGGVGHDGTLLVEAVDAVALHRTPHHVAIALTDGGDGGAERRALILQTPGLELRWRLLQHDQALRLASQPEVAVGILGDGPYLGRCQVHVLHHAAHLLQPLAAVGQAVEAVAARADIDIALTVLIDALHDDIRRLQRLQVDVSLGELAVVILVDAVHAEDEYLAATLGKVDDEAHGRRHLVDAGGIAHGELVVVAALPEAALAVLQDVVDVAHVGIAALENLVAMLADDVQPVVARRAGHQPPVGQLGHLHDPGAGPVGKGVVVERVRSVVIAVYALAGANPQLAVLVAEEAGHHVAVDGQRVVRMVNELGKPVAVVLVQSEVRGHPDVTILVLADVVDESA